jgi:hypothetical protein
MGQTVRLAVQIGRTDESPAIARRCRRPRRRADQVEDGDPGCSGGTPKRDDRCVPPLPPIGCTATALNANGLYKGRARTDCSDSKRRIGGGSYKSVRVQGSLGLTVANADTRPQSFVVTDAAWAAVDTAGQLMALR